MKFYLDEDISPKVSVIVRKKRLDAVSAHETGMLEASEKDYPQGLEPYAIEFLPNK